MYSAFNLEPDKRYSIKPMGIGSQMCVYPKDMTSGVQVQEESLTVVDLIYMYLNYTNCTHSVVSREVVLKHNVVDDINIIDQSFVFAMLDRGTIREVTLSSIVNLTYSMPQFRSEYKEYWTLFCILSHTPNTFISLMQNHS